MDNLTMKDSGVEWIGQIPEGWEVKRLKDFSKVLNGGTPKPEFIFDEKNDTNLFWATPSDFKDIEKNLSTSARTIDKKNLKHAGNLTKEGDLLISCRAPVGKVAYISGQLSFNQGCKAVIINNKNSSKYYFYYLIASKKALQELSNGTTFEEISTVSFRNSFYSTPKKYQQIAIANYLDTETSKIDRKISILGQKFSKLEEYRQSIIFETVTKGLDKTVPMRDSGIEWIGEIPEGWEVKRVKDSFYLKGGGSDKITVDGEHLVKLVNFNDVFKKISLDNTQDYMIVSCPIQKINSISLRKNDILITPSSETSDQIGLANIVLEDLINTVFSYHVLRLRRRLNDIHEKFTYYYLNSKFSGSQFEGKATGTTRVTLDRHDINSNIILLPKKDQQTAIANYLDSETTKIDNKKSIIKKQIALLKEYKQSIIYEAVTGKMEIK